MRFPHTAPPAHADPRLRRASRACIPGHCEAPIMSRKTLPLTAILLLSGALGTGCSGDTTDPGRPPPEICDDGIDNADDGLIDCDDTEACGGLQCITNTIDTDTTVPLDPAEIIFSAADCCNFTYGQGDCPLLVGTFQAANREED